MTSPVRVYVPWTVPAYRPANGAHPLLTPLLDAGGAGVRFFGPVADHSIEGARAVAAAFTRTARDTAERFRGHAVVQRTDVVDFIRTRDCFLHLAQPPDTALTFHHTVPWTIGHSPWVLHLEMPTLAFLPYLMHGTNTGRPLRSTPVYWLVRDLLEAPNCRAIFTHMRTTRNALGALFDSPSIDRKTRYVPPGAWLSPDDPTTLAAGAAARRRGGTVTVLFTNSWHQRDESFFLRGGADLVEAFFALKETCPELRLVLRSALPKALGAETIARLHADPAVTVLDRPVDEREILQLYARADIFALPSAGFHCLSVMRAMHAGAVCVTSDAPGFEEIVENGVTGMIVPGRRAGIYGVDPESGWLWDDYRPMFRRDPSAVDRLCAVLRDLCRNPDRRRALGEAARTVAQRRFRFDAWATGTIDVLHAAAEAGPPEAAP